MDRKDAWELVCEWTPGVVAPVNRAEIAHAAAERSVPLDEHIAAVLEAPQKDTDLVGLR